MQVSPVKKRQPEHTYQVTVRFTVIAPNRKEALKRVEQTLLEGCVPIDGVIPFITPTNGDVRKLG